MGYRPFVPDIDIIFFRIVEYRFRITDKLTPVRRRVKGTAGNEAPCYVMPCPHALHRKSTRPGFAELMAVIVTQVNRPARYRVRTAAVALAVAGILFVLYPALRPYTDETTLDGARAFASTAWVASHVIGMIGFIGLAIGLLGVHFARPGGRTGTRSFWALLLTWIGAGLTLTYYGAEVYALRVIGRLAVQSADPALLDLAHQVRFGPGMVLFGAGLALLAAGGILTAATVWRDHGLVAWGGVITGIAVALYLPQFFGPPPVRMAHGVLLATGCLWLAIGLWSRRAAEPRPAAAGLAPYGHPRGGQLPGLGVPAPRRATHWS